MGEKITTVRRLWEAVNNAYGEFLREQTEYEKFPPEEQTLPNCLNERIRRVELEEFSSFVDDFHIKILVTLAVVSDADVEDFVTRKLCEKRDYLEALLSEYRVEKAS